MIWSVVSKEEMLHCNSNPVFNYYKEALGKDNIKLGIVDDSFNIDFVGKRDIVLLRTGSYALAKNIKEAGVRSTAEEPHLYKLVADKEKVSSLLRQHGILVPRNYCADEIKEDRSYFVKPRYGAENKGISDRCICRSINEVHKQCSYMISELNEEPIIEDFIEGTECTVSCFMDSGVFNYASVAVVDGCCEPLPEKEAKQLGSICFYIYKDRGIRHHSRIDFRRDLSGKFYAIDINLIPGLGPTGLFARSLLVIKNYSYRQSINSVLNSATV